MFLRQLLVELLQFLVLLFEPWKIDNKANEMVGGEFDEGFVREEFFVDQHAVNTPVGTREVHKHKPPGRLGLRQRHVVVGLPMDLLFGYRSKCQPNDRYNCQHRLTHHLRCSGLIQ